MSKIRMIIFLIFLHATSWGQELPEFAEPDLQEMKQNKILSADEVARKRLYPGGSDEQSLEVQKPLFTPWRSVNLHLVQKETLEEILRAEEESESEVDEEKTESEAL